VPAGKVVSDPVSTLDLPQTFCDYAGTALPEPVHSRSLRPLIERDDTTRDFASSEWDLRASRCGVDLHLRTVRTRRHKLTVELLSGAGELYDLDDDPQEMTNRFDDAGYAAVRRELADMIASRPPMPWSRCRKWAWRDTGSSSAMLQADSEEVDRASSIACQILTGVAGIVMSFTPRSASASSTALMMAGGKPTEPLRHSPWHATGCARMACLAVRHRSRQIVRTRDAVIQKRSGERLS
jgi:hypothetical protein